MRSFVVFALFCCLGLQAQEGRKRLTFEQAVGLQGVEEIVVSPDGRNVAYRRRRANFLTNKREPSWSWGLCRSQPAPNAVAVVCSPDSRGLAMIVESEKDHGLYVSDWKGKKHICDVEKSNAFLPQKGKRLAWSSDGDHLAFAGTLEPKPETRDPVVVSRIQYKGRKELVDNRRTRVYVVANIANAEPRPLTPPGFDSHSIDWIPGTNEIVYLSNREPDPDAKHNYDIFVVNYVSGATRRLTETPGVEMTPMASPDGKWIAYTATTRKLTTIDSVAEDRHVWVMPARDGEARELNPGLDRRCTLAGWTPDAKAVLYLAQDHGKSVLWKTDVESGRSEALIDEQAWVGAAAMGADGTLYFTKEDPVTLRDVYRRKPGAPAAENVSRFTDSWRETYGWVEPETIHYRSFDGAEIEGWLYLPPGAEGTGKLPMILSIHGGPHGMYGYRYSGTFQFLVSRGYAVLALNPRGSTGYGQKFTDGCVNNWGGGDYKDLMAGVDYVLKQYPQIDAERLGVMGGSYGGFMTNWVVTQTGRFKAAVSIASVSNLISFYATSLYQDLVHAEFGGFPWEGKNFETLWKWSPLRYVKNVTTPTLLLHGEADNDVHITQAEEMYTALRRRGVPTRLIRYPREGHGLQEPKHRVDRLVRTIEWFDRYLRAE